MTNIANTHQTPWRKGTRGGQAAGWTRESAWTEALRLTRQSHALSAGQRWEARHFRAALDHLDRLWPSMTPLTLETRWTPCSTCKGTGLKDGPRAIVPHGTELAEKLDRAEITGTEYAVLRRWDRQDAQPCPTCGGGGWIAGEWRPIPLSLAWEIAWMAGTRRQTSVAHGGGLQPWSQVNWALTKWEFRRLCGPASPPPGSQAQDQAGRDRVAASLARAPSILERLKEAARGIPKDDLSKLSPAGWALLARRARTKPPTRGMREKVLQDLK